jgi:uncharacterized OB-fold protein
MTEPDDQSVRAPRLGLGRCPKCGIVHLPREECPIKAFERSPADKMVRGGRTLTK